MKRIREKGITLVALVVTIIILLILSGVTISQIIGNNGLFSRVKQAVDSYKKAQENESLEIDKLYTQLADLTGNSSGLTEEEIRKLIDEIVESKIKEEDNLEGSKLKLISTLSNNITTLGTYDITNFSREEVSGTTENYLSYDAENKQYTVLKSGWYTICSTLYTFLGAADFMVNDWLRVQVPDAEITVIGYPVSGSGHGYDQAQDSCSVYLSKGDYIKVVSEVSLTWGTFQNFTDATRRVKIYALDK